MDTTKQGWPLLCKVIYFQQICKYICNKLALESSNGTYVYAGGVTAVWVANEVQI